MSSSPRPVSYTHLDVYKRQVLSGEAGIGKSAMLGHVREQAQLLGCTVLATAGAESEAELGFAGLHQLLLSIIGTIEVLPDAQRLALEAAFGIATGVDPDPFRVAMAAFRLISDTADSNPVVLLADDAHWLDRPSVGVLTFIARRLEHVPICLLYTSRCCSTTSRSRRSCSMTPPTTPRDNAW